MMIKSGWRRTVLKLVIGVVEGTTVPVKTLVTLLNTVNPGKPKVTVTKVRVIREIYELGQIIDTKILLEPQK